MCETVLAPEQWKPTVVQLAPFSNTRSKVEIETCYSPRNDDVKRNYPILAVTRSNSGKASLTEIYEDSTDDKVEFKDDYQVPYSGRKPTSYLKTDRWVRSSFQETKMRTETDVDVRFSIQNLNDQVLTSRSDSVSITGDKSLEYMCQTESVNSIPDGKSFPDQVGIKKIAKLTPGELELQRFKESYAKDQAIRRKKYKVNASQIPRSTTPINDHDPDKLNMKQVINFLQNKTSKITLPQSRPRQNAVKLELHARASGSRERPATDTRALKQGHTSTVFQDRPATELPRESNYSTRDRKSNGSEQNVSRSGHSSRESACPSVLSTRSVPIIDRREYVEPQSRSSSRSLIEKANKSRPSRKQTKEFKLYRFLALAPNGQGQTTVPVVYSKRQSSDTETVKRKPSKKLNNDENVAVSVMYRSSALREIPLIQRDDAKSKNSECVQGNNFSVSYDKMNERKKLNRTANLVHRRAARERLERRKENSYNVEEFDKKPGPIRLPSVHDYDDDSKENNSDENESYDEFTEIRSVFSQSRVSAEDDNSELTSDVIINTSRSDITNDRLSNLHSNLVYQRLYGNTNNNKAKKISINVPHEQTSDTNDVIKLTLRQEKFVTPRRSYMHDIATPRYTQPVKYMHMNGFSAHAQDQTNGDTSIRTDVARSSFSELAEEQPLISGEETLANSCIKVRQKLKGEQ